MSSRPNPPNLSAKIITVSEKQLRAFIARSRWVYAKTMPEHPHEYVTRKASAQLGLEEMFERFVMHIRAHGYRERFGRATYTRLNLDEWKYWTMGAPLAITIILNRAQIDGGSDLIQALRDQPQLPLTK